MIDRSIPLPLSVRLELFEVMGRVRTKTVKRTARLIVEKYYGKLTLDFQVSAGSDLYLFHSLMSTYVSFRNHQTVSEFHPS